MKDENERTKKTLVETSRIFIVVSVEADITHFTLSFETKGIPNFSINLSY